METKPNDSQNDPLVTGPEPHTETPTAPTADTTPPMVDATPQVAPVEPSTPPVAPVSGDFSPVPPSSDTPPKKGLFSRIKGSKLAIAGLVALGVLLVAGGGAYAYYGVVLPNQPDNVIKLSAVKLLESETLGFDGTVTVTDKGDGVESLKLGIKGGLGADNLLANFDANISAFKLSGAVFVRFNEKQLFVKVNELPSLLKLYSGGDASLDGLASALNNKWIRISVADLKEAGYIDETTAAKAEKCVAGYASYLTATDTTKQVDQIVDAYLKNEFASATKVGKEEIDGVKATKYQLTIDTAKAEAFASEYNKASAEADKQLSEACGEVTQAAEALTGATTDQDATNTVSGAKLTDVYVWVANKKIVKISFVVDGKTEKTAVEVKLNNNPVDAPVPTEVITPKELQSNLEALFGGGLLL